MLHGTPKNFQKFPKISPECTRYNWPESIEKSNLSFTVWPHERSTFWKNMTRNGQNSRPAETDPYDNCNNCNNSNILEKLTKGRANETLPETMNSAASYIM